jgi:hypothetical protein
VPTAVGNDARTRLAGALGARAGDAIAVEQLLDVVTFRQFRASPWCREDASREVPTPAEWLSGAWLAAEPSAHLRDDVALGALRDRWPSDVAFEELAAREADRDALAHRMLAAFRPGDVTVRARETGLPRDLAERPRVWPLTRLEASELSFVTTPRHAYAPLDPFHAALIRHLDGSRSVTDLVAALGREVEEGRLRAGGATPAQVVAALPRLVPSGLALLHRAGLLVG